MKGRLLFKKNKFLIGVLVFLISCLPKSMRVLFWDIISPFSQLLFIGIRYIILKSLIRECGDNVRTGKNVTILHPENLILGKNISIHSNSYIDAAGGICIGDNVSIAHNSSILSSTHTWNNREIPIKYNEIKLSPLIIKDDVWIGCGCRILGGIEISSRVIIAAGAVVNKNCEPDALYGGIPARLIKKINI